MPANPILVRVVSAGGRRIQHLWIRAAYVAILAFAVVIGVVVIRSQGQSSLSELAKNASQVFRVLSIIQLLMVCIIAPVFASAAITQEKNSQTFNILLSTPLTNGQIVLGSLLSRLYFVVNLLLAGVPLFCIMMVYGGVTGREIILSSALAATTALLTGSIAIAISVIKIGTGRTIFSFYLAIATYLIVMIFLAEVPAMIPAEAPPPPGNFGDSRMSWLAAFHPFLSLWVVLGLTPAPELGAVSHYGFPMAYWLAYPHLSFMAMTVLGSLVLIVLSMFFVRRGAKEGEDTFWSRVLRNRRHVEAEAGEQTRKPRHVWDNPVAWRESVTGAAAGGGRLLRVVVIGGGAIVALGALFAYGKGWFDARQAQAMLFGVVSVELFIALFIATATAATSLTREKESATLELVLSTPLTSSQIIRGKIRGLIAATGPLLVIPYATVVAFFLLDLVKRRPPGTGPVVNPESLLTLPVLFIAFTGFACVIGLDRSIKNRKTLTAVFTSMAFVIFVFALPSACVVPLRGSDSHSFTAALMSASPANAVWVALAPQWALEPPGTKLTSGDFRYARYAAAIAALCTAAIYFAIVRGLHGSMVRQFDMIIRKQSA